MDILVILIALVIVGVSSFSLAAMFNARSYDRGYRDGLRARPWMARPDR